MQKLNATKCLFCNSKRLYQINEHTIKCSHCFKKYSLKKLQIDFNVLEYFLNDISANKCAKELALNYKSVKDRFVSFRKLIINQIEENYSKNHNAFSEYEEYYFLPKKKHGKVKYLYESIGILGMLQDDLIYTILMPDEFAHLREEKKIFGFVDMAHLKEYSKYLNRYKLMHFEKFDSKIIRFWVYLEEKTLHYKGINRDNFVYYLKEYEFKFNYEKKEQLNILWSGWVNAKR